MTTEQETLKRIEEANPDLINWNDPNAYAALGVGSPDEGEAADSQGDNAVQQPAAPAPAPAAPPIAAPAAPAPVSASPAAAAPATTPTEAAEGIASRDGKHIIPYAVLEATRREAKANAERIAQLEQQLAEKVASASPAGNNALADRAANDPNSLTDAEIEELAADFPQLAKPLRLLRAAAAKVEELSSGAAAPRAAPTAATAPAPSADPEQDAFDAGLAANPLLAKWMGEGGKEWTRATQIDRVLHSDPDYARLSYADRFARVQRMVAAEFGHSLPSAPTPTPQPAAPAAHTPAQRAFPSLGDMGGAPPRSEEDTYAQMNTTDMLAAFERMDDGKLQQLAGVRY